MFSARNTDSPSPFRPAVQYLLSSSKSQSRHQSSSSRSIDSKPDGAPGEISSADFRNTSIPFLNISRSTSPHLPRHSGSNSASDTDDDDWGDQPSLYQQPFPSQEPANLRGSQALLKGGGLGQFLFTTSLGWQLYIAVLVLWLVGCEIGLTVINRVILWSAYLKDNYTSHTKLMPLIAGVYKFPYPLTTTLIEMVIAHGFILLSAYVTRFASPWLTSAGLAGMIAPPRPLHSKTLSGQGGRWKNNTQLQPILKWISSFSGGIAGGGLFEFDLAVVRQVLPVAIVFVAKVTLSNLSFTYAQLQIYILARIWIVPISLLLTALLTQAPPSVSTISAALTAALTLLVTASHSNVPVTWESIAAGVFSSFFVGLYPIQLQRTYKCFLASIIPQGDLLTSTPKINSCLPPDHSGSPEEARAYWRLLHYTSLLSILMFVPIVFLSGEISSISRNSYFMDVSFDWLMILCGSLGSWAVFVGTIALTRATSPLTTTFLFIPCAALLLPIIAGFKMPAYTWIGMGMCWASCAWFLRQCRKEGRRLGTLG